MSIENIHAPWSRCSFMRAVESQDCPLRRIQPAICVTRPPFFITVQERFDKGLEETGVGCGNYSWIRLAEFEDFM